jgi:hypothetical protein
MSLTLMKITERVSCHLNDTGNLIWSEVMLETAVRSALLALGRVLEESITLEGLDGAVETTLAEDDQHVLVVGAVAYALTFRASGRFEDARGKADLPKTLADWATAHMTRFQTMLAEVKGRSHQESTTAPYDQWVWDEEEG